MFNKIIKRGHRKVKKSYANGFGFPASGISDTGLVYSSSVVVNHSSRAIQAVNLRQQQSSANPNLAAPLSRVIETLPLFRDVQPSERQDLFYRKLQICFIQFDFSDILKMIREKEMKRHTLSQLVEFLQSGSEQITQSNQEEMVRMISFNLFRCLPPTAHKTSGPEFIDPDEDEIYFDPSWPHLQLVYELLLRYIESSDTDTKIAKRYIDHTFVLRLLDLFESDDPREREFLKNIIHRIYAKFMIHRPFIRKSISNIFSRFIYETPRHSGINELLEIAGSIISGFALPMKEEHKLFLVRALIPLHKPKLIATYHQQLSYCIVQFVEKDDKLAEVVISGLLKCWPMTNCQKEVLFLGELEEVLDATQAAEFQHCMVPLFRRLSRSLTSPHFQVAERALFLWNNDHIISLIAQNRSVVLPIIFQGLETNIRSHWNQAINGLSLNVRKMFLDMDIELFEECRKQNAEKMANAQDLLEQRELTWQRLAAAASQGV